MGKVKTQPNRRDFLATGALALLGTAVPRFERVYSAPSFNLIIKGAWILDGTGGPAWKADLGVAGDTIVALGEISPEQGGRVIHAEGMCVSPGFIDIHTHSDYSVLAYPEAESRVFQGITTELTGNCGGSAAPLSGVDLTRRRKQLAEEIETEVDWTDVESYFERIEEERISLNQAILLGQGTLRENAVGLINRPLKPDELASVVLAVEKGMDQGAIGISTGLEYVPGSYTPTEEIVAMAQAVARRGGLYSTHIRDEGPNLLAAVNEAIDIGRQTGVRVEISHFKSAGRPNWSKQDASIHLVESARRSGVSVLADAYPYHAYSTGLTIYIPGWAQEGGSEALVARLKEKVARQRIESEVAEAIRNDPGSYDAIVISQTRTKKNRNLLGKNLEEIAADWNVSPLNVLLTLLEEEASAVSFVGFGIKPENVEKVLSHPLVMVGSDGSIMAPRGKAGESRPHPRSYGTCPRVLGHYCREREIFDLPTAVKKMTSMPADQMGLKDRGRIAPGKKADLVIFDRRTVEDKATFEKPHQYPIGISHVFVNGTPVIQDGDHTGKRPGRILRADS